MCQIEGKCHLTDLSFFQYCLEYSGINRGVYNTIDSWFYDKGIKDILIRRKAILHFLDFLDDKISKGKGGRGFGFGGLSTQLHDFWVDYNVKN